MSKEVFLPEELFEAEYKLQNCIRITTNVENFTTEIYTGLRWIPVTEYVQALIESITLLPANEYICCEELGKALGDHRGLHSQSIGSMTSDKMDDIIMYTGGDYKLRNRIVVQYCPFCGKPRRRASEYNNNKKEQ